MGLCYMLLAFFLVGPLAFIQSYRDFQHSLAILVFHLLFESTCPYPKKINNYLNLATSNFFFSRYGDFFF
jgi:hypothetical protein